MIIDVLFAAVRAIIQPVLDIFPTWSLVSTLGLPSAGTAIGEFLHPLDGIFPIGALVTMLYDTALVILPFYAIYKLGNWAWRHIPDIGGFGPGAG